MIYPTLLMCTSSLHVKNPPGRDLDRFFTLKPLLHPWDQSYLPNKYCSPGGLFLLLYMVEMSQTHILSLSNLVWIISCSQLTLDLLPSFPWDHDMWIYSQKVQRCSKETLELFKRCLIPKIIIHKMFIFTKKMKI